MSLDATVTALSQATIFARSEIINAIGYLHLARLGRNNQPRSDAEIELMLKPATDLAAGTGESLREALLAIDRMIA